MISNNEFKNDKSYIHLRNWIHGPRNKTYTALSLEVNLFQSETFKII